MSSYQPLINAFNSLRKRDGDYLTLLKALYFETLKDKYPTKKISDLLLESKGGSWGNENFENSIKAKVLRSPDIRFGFIDFEKAEERFFTDKEIENFNLRDNDILVIKSNGSLDLVGKSQILKSNSAFPYVVASNFLLVLRPDTEEVYPEYLDLFLKSPQALIWRFDEQKTTTGLRNLNTKGYLSLEMPFPDSIEEQKKLYDDFQRYKNQNFHERDDYYQKVFTASNSKENLTTELNHQLALVKELRQAYLREAMQGKLVPQNSADEPAGILLEKVKAEKEKLVAEKRLRRDKPLLPIKSEEIPFEIPSNWTWCRLGEICGFITKGTTPNTNKITAKGDIPYLKVYNIVQQKIDFDYKPQFIDKETHLKVLNRSRVFPNDVLMNIVEPPLGKVAIIPNTYPEWNINQALAIFRPLVKGISNYLYHYLCEGSSIRIIRTLGVVGQDNISLEQSRNMIFPLPPLAEQERIVAKLEKLMKFCDELEANIRQGIKNADQLLQTALKEALEMK